eukprot:358750-Chlamydomonas_euryale.AAC.2
MCNLRNHCCRCCRKRCSLLKACRSRPASAKHLSHVLTTSHGWQRARSTSWNGCTARPTLVRMAAVRDATL